MKRLVVVASSLLAAAAFAQYFAGLPVPSPNRLSAAQPSSASGGHDPVISAGRKNNPLLMVDSMKKAVGRYESRGTVIFLVNGIATRLQNLSADCPTSDCATIRSSQYVFADPQNVINNVGALYYTSSDCSGAPYMVATDRDVTRAAIAVKEADASFYIYVADAAGQVSYPTFLSQFVNGQCSAVAITLGAHPVSTVFPASALGTPPFHIQ